ncbi:MAG: glycosyltransferase family 2 protein [Novosphingobium sp.]
MTCHNRRELTLACLRTLAAQPLFDPQDLYLVDDGSHDGTGPAVKALLPAANVMDGDGSLFWNGGMRLAWSRAVAAGGYDFYLWLNDDVALADDCLAMLTADADAVIARGGAVIVAAATTEPGGTRLTYGAHRRTRRDRPLRLNLLAPAGRPIPADTISGNIVLVSAAAERRLGNMSASFEHIYGDLDYGFRAQAAGIPVLLASRTGGTCAANSAAGSSRDGALGLWRRVALVRREAQTIHGRDWRRFVALHGGGPLARIGHRVMPYLRIILDRPHRHAANVITEREAH